MIILAYSHDSGMSASSFIFLLYNDISQIESFFCVHIYAELSANDVLIYLQIVMLDDLKFEHVVMTLVLSD